MSIASKRCHGELHRGTKKSPLATGSQGLFPEDTLARSSSKKALFRLQRDRIRLTQHFLDKCDAENVTAECRHKAGVLIETIIDRYPDCPHFASLLVDRLLAGQEGLEQALREEMGL
jgi:hypothetical protein